MGMGVAVGVSVSVSLKWLRIVYIGGWLRTEVLIYNSRHGCICKSTLARVCTRTGLPSGTHGRFAPCNVKFLPLRSESSRRKESQ